MPLLETNLPGLKKRRGKVRDVYELDDKRLLIVATDRISAFDWVLPTPIPDKGRVLTAISLFWFARLNVPHHLISDDPNDSGLNLNAMALAELTGRTMIVRKADVIPYECVVRGYLSGSGWKEYRASGTVCGEPLPDGLRESDRIEPIFTPATKAETGHDENVSFETVKSDGIYGWTAEELRAVSLRTYRAASEYALSKGLILADTKFELGFPSDGGDLMFVDEVLTPDSSRYWAADQYAPGGPQLSFDKQFVRDYLETTGWDKQSTPPPLPDEVVAKTRAKYIECYEILTGLSFPWK